MTYKLIGLATALHLLGASPIVAEDKIGPDRYAVTLQNLNTNPKTAAEARATLSRIESAALAVCGAPHGSSSILKRAILRSQCFKDSVAEAVRAINDPLINRLHNRAG